ncbi:TPA: type I restriction-modification system subunit M, partial [Staphylococcus aureus]
IKENDYNLNIPRYVDTFEEEEPIDLDQVQQQLSDIDKDIAEVESEINGYLKELGVLKHD